MFDFRSSQEKAPHQVAGISSMGAPGAAMDAEGTAWSPPPLNHFPSQPFLRLTGLDQPSTIRQAEARRHFIQEK